MTSNRTGSYSVGVDSLNQQKPTETNENEALEEKYQVAVEMRVEGYRYKKIAEVLKVKEQTVREWFMKGGRCHVAYQQRVKQWKQETEELYKKVQDEIKSGAVDAAVVLKEAVNKGDTKAAQDLLDRAGFPKKTAIDFDGTLTPSPELIRIGNVLEKLIAKNNE